MSKIMTVNNHPLVRGWYDALLSNEHMQGTGTMEKVDKTTGITERCCLGVLCRVAMKMGLELKTTNTNCGTGFGHEANAGLLPHEVALALFGEYDAEELYDEHRDPYLKPFEDAILETSASDLNDNEDFTFEMIAAAIKRTWPEAFTE